MSYFLRSVHDYDAKLLFKWANDPEVRKASFSSGEIKWEEHVKWLNSLLEDADRDIFICMDFMAPVGVVRIARDSDKEDRAAISYLTAPDYRELGVGTKMLRLLEDRVPEDVKVLKAEVKPDNEGSIKIFEKLGYKRVEENDKKLVFEKDISEPAEKKKASGRPYREPQFEVMRVVAMLMVIMLHYQMMGGRLNRAPSGLGLPVWIVEAMCIVSVNLYVMISGYFLTEKSFSIRKLVRLWGQVFFYSVMVWIVCMITGVVDVRDYISFENGLDINFYDIQFMLFPIINRHYWYATVYIIFYILSPLLAAGVNRLNKRQITWMLILLTCLLSIPKSLLPVEFPIDDYGYSVTWFAVLFLAANYIRRFGIPFFEKKRNALLTYAFSVAMIVLVEAICIKLWGPQGDRYYYAKPLHYNFIFVALASVALFCFFKNLRIKENFFTSFIVWIAPYTFGVYLLHTHKLVMYSWPIWLWVGGDYGWIRPFHTIFTVITIFALGIFIDIIRSRLFLWIEKLIDLCMEFYFEKREVFDYLITGFLTTVICWGTYAVFDDILLKGMEEVTRVLISDAISWFVAVVFAYVISHIFVFHSDKHGFKEVSREFVSFVAARLATLALELGMLYVLVSLLHVNEKLSKYLIVSVVVIIINYILSKLFVFKKKEASK